MCFSSSSRMTFARATVRSNDSAMNSGASGNPTPGKFPDDEIAYKVMFIRYEGKSGRHIPWYSGKPFLPILPGISVIRLPCAMRIVSFIKQLLSISGPCFASGTRTSRPPLPEGVGGDPAGRSCVHFPDFPGGLDGEKDSKGFRLPIWRKAQLTAFFTKLRLSPASRAIRGRSEAKTASPTPTPSTPAPSPAWSPGWGGRGGPGCRKRRRRSSGPCRRRRR